MDNEEVKEQVTEENGAEVNEQEPTAVEQPQAETPQANDSDEQPEFVLDENGNLQWKEANEADTPTEESEGQPSTEESEQSASATAEPRYKVKVDGKEQEVSLEELTKGYMRQADYTRKTQELAERRKQVQQYQQPQMQGNPMAGQQAQAPNLNEIAKRLAVQRLGLQSEDDLSELNFDHQMAVFEAKQTLLNQRNQMVSREMAMQNLESQLRSEDPAYEDIMASAKEKMEALPYKQYRALQTAYEQGNPEPLRAFYNNVLKKEYYSNAIKKVETSKKPVPKVVSAGNTPAEANPSKRIDFSKLGTMSSEQKAKFLMDNGFLDN